ERASQVLDRARPDIELLALMLGILGLRRRLHQIVPGIAGEIGKGNVFRDGDIEQKARALAVLGNQENAVLDRLAGRGDGHGLVAETDIAAGLAVDAEEDPGELGAARANETGEAQYFTFPQDEADAAIGECLSAQLIENERIAARR